MCKDRGCHSKLIIAVQEFPPALREIASSVRVLDATNNRITPERLPDYLAQFAALQRLLLTRNALTSLPPAVGSLQNLKVLMVDSNQLTALPNSLGQLPRLERLSAAGNCLTALPATLGKLGTLRQLDVSANKLMALPPELGSCTALEELTANDNYLQAVPASLSSLQQLKTLQLDKNRIQAIPPGVLAECTSLQTLSLHGNPITVQAVQETDGYAAFEQRRRSKFDKSIGAGVLLDSKGLDEGLDRRTT
ncbi:hypothetical protein N2152v2_004754 [Parachlorella kessleri]